MSTKKRSLIPDRESLIETLFRAGRENSMATVMFHTVVAEFMGLAPSDSKTLDLLDRSGPMSPSEIAAQTGLTAGSVTSLVDRLEKKGFVRRVRTSKDRRSIVVELAAERLAAAVPLFDPFRRSAEALVKDYSDSDLEVIADFLKGTRNGSVERRRRFGNPAIAGNDPGYGSCPMREPLDYSVRPPHRSGCHCLIVRFPSWPLSSIVSGS